MVQIPGGKFGNENYFFGYLVVAFVGSTKSFSEVQRKAAEL